MATSSSVKRPPSITSPPTISVLPSSESSRFLYRLWRIATYSPALKTASVIASRSTYHSVRRRRMERKSDILVRCASGKPVPRPADSLNQLPFEPFINLLPKILHVHINHIGHVVKVVF